jgi:hypothetical protein
VQQIAAETGRGASKPIPGGTPRRVTTAIPPEWMHPCRERKAYQGRPSAIVTVFLPTHVSSILAVRGNRMSTAPRRRQPGRPAAERGPVGRSGRFVSGRFVSGSYPGGDGACKPASAPHDNAARHNRGELMTHCVITTTGRFSWLPTGAEIRSVRSGPARSHPPARICWMRGDPYDDPINVSTTDIPT